MLHLPPPEWTAHYRRLDEERRAGWISGGECRALEALARIVASGEDDPTNADIAVLAGVSARTVRRARAKGEARGLLFVAAQFVLVDGRRQQRANRYVLKVPAGPLFPKPRRGGQAGRPSRVERKQEALKDEVGGAVNLLAARIRVMEARLRGASP